MRTIQVITWGPLVTIVISYVNLQINEKGEFEEKVANHEVTIIEVSWSMIKAT